MLANSNLLSLFAWLGATAVSLRDIEERPSALSTPASRRKMTAREYARRQARNQMAARSRARNRK